MEILPYQTPSAPVANVTNLIQAVVINPDDLATITAVNSKLESIAKVSATAQPSNSSRPGQWRGHWHLECDLAAERLGENPTIENAEEYHRLFVRARQASETAHLIGGACADASRRVSMTLAEVAGRIIDAAGAVLENEAATARNNLLRVDGGMFGNAGLQTLENQVAALRAGLAAEREAAAGNPAWWIFQNGIGVDVPEPAPAPPAPAPPPEVKAPRRGRVELPASDLATEMAGDFH